MTAAKQSALKRMKRAGDALACPICRAMLSPEGGESLVCQNRHNFDIHGSGTVNFLSKPVKESYSKALFEARRELSRRGFFDPLVEAVLAALPQDAKRLLDAGCGEGAVAGGLWRRFEGKDDALWIGVDIAKDAVRIAAKAERELLWLTGDLTRLPIRDESQDVVLNILSPAHYGEFSRVLRRGGLLIKAIPGSAYLSELRALFFAGSSKDRYLGHKTKERLEQSFFVVERRTARASFVLDEETWHLLLEMTPLLWPIGEEERRDAFHKRPGHISLEYEILIGRPQGGEDSF